MAAEPPVISSAPESVAPNSEESQHRAAAPVAPVTSLHDPRVVQILSTEHWSLLASRSLAYNEAFIRGGMFLSFLSMSFVGLALLAQAMGFSDGFLIVAVVVLAFDFIIGLLTCMRIAGTGADDLRNVHGTARIRHGYTEIAPLVEPYFTTAIHDDIGSVLTAYGPPSSSPLGDVLYGLSTSLGMIGLITAMVGGVLGSVVAYLVGIAGVLAVLVGVVVTAITLGLMVVVTFRGATRHQAMLGVRFPAPSKTEPLEAVPAA